MVQVSDVEPSMDLQFTSQTTGEVSVYNLGDIAWGESHLERECSCHLYYQSSLPWH